MADMMPRVAVINTHPIQYLAPLWREIAKTKQVELRVFYCCDWGATEYVDDGFGRAFKWDVDLLAGYDSKFLPILQRPKGLGFWETDNPTISRALAEFGPEVLLLCGYGHLTNWRALMWARTNGVRVLTLSDSELKHPRAAWVRVAKQFVVRAFFSQLDGALPISSSNAQYYRHYGLPADRLYVGAQPIDGARFLAALGQRSAVRAAVRKKLNMDLDEFVFAAVGKYIPKKRTTDVVRGWLDLDRSLRCRGRLLLIGEGELRPQLERLAGLPEAEGRITLTGFVNQQELPSLYLACDATVLASEAEPHGQVVTESLFLGLPAIVSDRVGCVGPTDVLRHGENGFVFACGDTDALSAAMKRLMTEPETYRKLSEKGREIASEQDARVAAEKFVAAFQRTLLSRRPGFLARARTAIPFREGRVAQKGHLGRPARNGGVAEVPHRDPRLS
jgi:glycosyltransferase involved in cell wall biosynthesis